MNAVTASENTALATMPPAARAALAMKTTSSELALRELIKASAGILTVTNKAGREECHTAYMRLKNSVTDIGKTEVAVTEDAKAFTKAVKAEAARLAEIIIAERDRLQALRDNFDAAEQARKDAEIAAEMARIAAIASALEGIRERGTDVAFIDKTAADTQASIDNLESMPITDTIYQERLAEAVELKAATMAQMRIVLADRIAAEAAEAQRLADIAAADKRRAEEAAENARVAAHNERVANELAVAARKLAEQQATIELLDKQRAEQAEANAKAEADARAEAARKAQALTDLAAAEAQAQLAAVQAQIAEAKQKLADDLAAEDARKVAVAAQEKADGVRDEAVAMNLQFDIGAVMAAAINAAAVVPAPAAITSLPADLADAADELRPTDDAFHLKAMARSLGVNVIDMIDHLIKMDLVAARAVLVSA